MPNAAEPCRTSVEAERIESMIASSMSKVQKMR